MIVDNGKYYLYRHIRLDTEESFYIGIGTKKGYFSRYTTEYSRAYSKYKRSVRWARIVDKVGYRVEILLESDDYHLVKMKEVYFIELYKRFTDGGCLVNMTKGGDGTHGFSRTPEINKAIANKIRGVHNLRSIRCYQYNIEGGLVKEWGSFNMAAVGIGALKQNILQAKDNSTLCKNHYWSNIKYTNFIKESPLYINRINNISNNHFTRSVTAFNDKETLTFNSIVDAAVYFTGDKNKKSNIKKVLSGSYNQAYGYKFTYNV